MAPESRDSRLRRRYSELSGSFVADYEPIRLFFYEHYWYPYVFLNPLSKSLLCHEPRFSQGNWLFEVVSHPDLADFMVLPCDLSYFEDRVEDVLEGLVHYRGNESRHILFDLRDDPGVPEFLERSIFLKVSMYADDVSDRRICIPYTERIDNMFPLFMNQREPHFDVSFVGLVSERREPVLDAIEASGLSCRFVRRREDYFEATPFRRTHSADQSARQQQVAWRREFLESVLDSRFAIAIQGHGLNSFRFFEALSLGVPPVLISEELALPFMDQVNYSAMSLRFHIDDSNLGFKVGEAIKSIDRKDLTRMRRQARHTFDTYLSSWNLLFLLYERIRRVKNGNQNLPRGN